MPAQQRKSEANTLDLHKKAYERRIMKIKQRTGLTEQEIADMANNPLYFRRETEQSCPTDNGNGSGS